MFFHIHMVDYPVSRRDAGTRERHRKYLEERADCIILRGATHGDDGAGPRSSVIHVELPDRAAVETFVANEPNNLAGVYMNVEIHRWNNPLGRRQRDFPRREGQTMWFIRGYAKSGIEEKRKALHDAHLAYFKPYDAAQFLTRGGTLTDDGGTWTGSVLIIDLPSRAAVHEFMANEPFCKAGLFRALVIEKYGFGGLPGQVV